VPIETWISGDAWGSGGIIRSILKLCIRWSRPGNFNPRTNSSSTHFMACRRANEFQFQYRSVRYEGTTIIIPPVRNRPRPQNRRVRGLLTKPTELVWPLEELEAPENNYHKNKQTPWPESKSEQYRPSDRRLSAKLVSTFAVISAF
jgi:hypothetical protein